LAGFTADSWKTPPTGAWEIKVRANSTTLKVRLTRRPDGDYDLIGPGVFRGVYTVLDNQLVVKTPADRRMAGLAWAWKDGELVLVTEPASHPTGAVYLGARMRPVDAE
jgi:hypothetical protein